MKVVNAVKDIATKKKELIELGNLIVNEIGDTPKIM